MHEKQAYDAGFQRGYNIASWVDAPEIGTCLSRHVDWQGIGVIETEQDQADAIQLMASEAEENDRQFSPFEQLANDLNSHNEEDREALWDAFDDGISNGISKRIEEWRAS